MHIVVTHFGPHGHCFNFIPCEKKPNHGKKLRDYNSSTDSDHIKQAIGVKLPLVTTWGVPQKSWSEKVASCGLGHIKGKYQTIKNKHKGRPVFQHQRLWYNVAVTMLLSKIFHSISVSSGKKQINMCIISTSNYHKKLQFEKDCSKNTRAVHDLSAFSTQSYGGSSGLQLDKYRSKTGNLNFICHWNIHS